MLVYPAYGMLVLHVLLGALRSEPNPLYLGMLGIGFATVCGLHITVGIREQRRDQPRRIPLQQHAEWIDVGTVE